MYEPALHHPGEQTTERRKLLLWTASIRLRGELGRCTVDLLLVVAGIRKGGSPENFDAEGVTGSPTLLGVDSVLPRGQPGTPGPW